MISSIWCAGVCTQATCLHSVGVTRPNSPHCTTNLWFVVNKGAKRINTYITMTSIRCSFRRVCFVWVSFELQLHQHVALIITWHHSLSRSRWFDVLHQYQRISMKSQMVFFHVLPKIITENNSCNATTTPWLSMWPIDYRLSGFCENA